MLSDPLEALLLNCPDRILAPHALRRLCIRLLLCVAVCGVGVGPSLVLAHDSGGSSRSGSSSSKSNTGGANATSSGSTSGGTSGGTAPGRSSSAGSSGGSEKTEKSEKSDKSDAKPKTESTGVSNGTPSSGSSATSASPSSAVRLRESDHDQARQAVQSGQIQPLRVLMARIEKEHPGEVMEVELERHDGAWIYEIKLLQPGGWLTKLKVDARSGVVVKQQGRRALVNREHDD